MSVYRMNVIRWSVERVMFVFGGGLVIGFSVLALFVHLLFAWGALFVGGMFVIFATTGYCPGAIVVARMMKK